MNKYGKLTIISNAPPTKHSKGRVECLCECGKTIITRKYSIKIGKTTSCGCAQREIARKTMTKHGLYNIPEYDVWSAMKSRCKDLNDPAFKNYGHRGIKVCERWNSFENFIDDMGRRPSSKHSLDRINNDLGYGPSNCRWVTRDIQNSNHRRNRNFTHNGLTMNIHQWAIHLNLSERTLRSRLQRGASFEEAINR